MLIQSGSGLKTEASIDIMLSCRPFSSGFKVLVDLIALQHPPSSMPIIMLGGSQGDHGLRRFRELRGDLFDGPEHSRGARGPSGPDRVPRAAD